MSFSSFWQKIAGSPARLPSRLAIRTENTDQQKFLGSPFVRHKHYFTVVVNEMFLTQKRQWFSEFTPAVMACSEFLYDGKKQAVPFLVGPAMMQGKMERLPAGFVFQNTTVAGQHPYLGGEFAVSIVLARLKTNDYLRKILKILESTSATYMGGFGKMVSQYSKVADIVLDGFDDLLGNEDLQPVLGQRLAFQGINEDFSPGYYAIIDLPEKELQAEKFFVKRNQLLHGKDAATASPFRDADYVLYSILSSSTRNDTDALPFHQEFSALQELISDMQEIGPTEKTLLNGRLFSLQALIRSSPDLIRPQAGEMIAEYRAEIEKMIGERQALAVRGEKQAEEKDPWEMKMDQMALEILKAG